MGEHVVEGGRAGDNYLAISDADMTSTMATAYDARTINRMAATTTTTLLLLRDHLSLPRPSKNIVLQHYTRIKLYYNMTLLMYYYMTKLLHYNTTRSHVARTASIEAAIILLLLQPKFSTVITTLGR